MQTPKRVIQVYVNTDGKCPFYEWLYSISDVAARTKIRARLARIRTGNFGDVKSVGNHLFEFRIHYGPGYRIYFSYEGKKIIILVTAGEKKTQKKDIKKAQKFWADYKRRKSAINYKLS